MKRQYTVKFTSCFESEGRVHVAELRSCILLLLRKIAGDESLHGIESEERLTHNESKGVCCRT